MFINVYLYIVRQLSTANRFGKPYIEASLIGGEMIIRSGH